MFAPNFAFCMGISIIILMWEDYQLHSVPVKLSVWEGKSIAVGPLLEMPRERELSYIELSFPALERVN